PEVQGFGSQLVAGDTVPAQDLVELQAVDGAERIKAVDRGYSSFVFNVGETTQGNREFVALMARGALLAGLFHNAIGQFEAIANPLESFARTVHDMILAGSNPVVTARWAGFD